MLKKFRFAFFLPTLLCCLCGYSFSQTADVAAVLDAVPDGFRSVRLGLPVDEVKKELQADGLFGYRGERDVSLLPTQERVLIETSGTGFLSRSWFQFYQEQLYTIILNLNTEKLDFYSVFNTLRKKYGEPTSLTPEKIVWRDEATIMSLERPLVLKYVDAVIFDELQQASRSAESVTEITRKNFLDSL